MADRAGNLRKMRIDHKGGRGIGMYSVEVTNKGGSIFNIKSKDCEFAADTNGAGMTPPDILLAGLGSCIGVYVRKYAEGAKLDIGGFTVNVSADLDKEKPVCFRNIKVAVDLGGALLDERRKVSMLEFIKNCPVHNTLKNNPSVSFELT